MSIYLTEAARQVDVPRTSDRPLKQSKETWICCPGQFVWCFEGQRGIWWLCVRDLDPWRLLVFDESCVGDLFSLSLHPPSLMSTYTLPRAHMLWRKQKRYGVHQQPPRLFPRSILHSIMRAVCGMKSSACLTHFCPRHHLLLFGPEGL